MVQPNTDQAVIRRFQARPDTPCPVDSNSMAIALGARLVRIDEEGAVTLSFSPEPLFIQGAGVLQGGAVSAMLDFAMAFAVLAALPDGRTCATVNLATAFLRPAPRGDYLAVGRIERKGSAVAFAQSVLMPVDAPARLVASASSTLMLGAG
ncbi:PaaI family thioesterase [Cupriavidus oxalaticus]|uniref:PaaI family thioesterase n=1 Tax=Cupriavidus oxalaticus TaxID=96344 RepID=UPI0031829C95